MSGQFRTLAMFIIIEHLVVEYEDQDEDKDGTVEWIVMVEII